MTAEFTVLGISRLDDHVLLADAGLAMAMVAAGAQRLVDLRGETSPPRLPVPVGALTRGHRDEALHGRTRRGSHLIEGGAGPCPGHR